MSVAGLASAANSAAYSAAYASANSAASSAYYGYNTSIDTAVNVVTAYAFDYSNVNIRDNKWKAIEMMLRKFLKENLLDDDLFKI